MSGGQVKALSTLQDGTGTLAISPSLTFLPQTLPQRRLQLPNPHRTRPPREILKFRPSSTLERGRIAVAIRSFLSTQASQIASDYLLHRHRHSTLWPLESVDIPAHGLEEGCPQRHSPEPLGAWVNIKIPSFAPAASGQSTRDRAPKDRRRRYRGRGAELKSHSDIGQRWPIGANSATLTKIAGEKGWIHRWPSFLFSFFLPSSNSSLWLDGQRRHLCLLRR